jgi:indolepyruvate ferredoxin oxidoreductase beta subunit
MSEQPTPVTDRPAARPEQVDIALVGVGGQGTILASDILAELGLRAGYDVKKAEVHGMSQRGGSVVSHVRWAPRVHSPIIPEGGADVLVAFEKMEAARYAALLAPSGVVVVNEHEIDPVTVITGGAHYPTDEEITGSYGPQQRLLWVGGTRVARELGNANAANVVLLGVLSVLVGLEPSEWEAVITARVTPRHLPVNLAAFAAGRALLDSAAAVAAAG